jgi:hypothetical protein
MLVLSGRSDPVLTALEASTVMLMGGEPLGPRNIWWNFDSSRRNRFEQAKADWQSGRIHLSLSNDQEFIPYQKTQSPLLNRCHEPSPLADPRQFPIISIDLSDIATSNF